jgi:glyoxylase-like metal-dependent hydrolase (beta-lactamase superfamily II)
VRVARTTVLVDTGPDLRLLDLLAANGVAPDDVDRVVITHGHADHVGALLRDGAPTFPRARHLMAAAEQAFRCDPETRERVAAEAPGHDAAIAVLAEALPALRDAGLLHDVADQEVVAPGVRVLHAAGHTPGHLILAIERGGERALHFGDLVSHRLHVDHLGWLPVWDLARAEQVKATKRRVLARAADEGALVTASHVPAPGRIERAGDGLRWVDA